MSARWLWLWVGVGLTSAPAAALTVQGRVIDGAGEPVAGAVVSARAVESETERALRLFRGTQAVAAATARSADDGRFQLAAAGPALELEARAAGFGLAFALVRDESPVTLVLRAAALRKGTVVAAGRPVAGARLTWSAGDSPAATWVALSAADGGFSVPDPDAWAWSLTIQHPEFDVLEQARDGAWPLTLRFELPTGAPLAGRVVTATPERAVADAVVRIDGTVRAISGADGHFRVAAAPRGWSEVTAEAGDLVGRARPGGGPVRIALTPGREIVGVVREAGNGHAIAGARVGAFAQDGGDNRTTFTDASGGFTLRGLRPGRYSTWASVPGYRVKRGATTVIDLRRAGSARHALELQATARLAGRVVDEAEGLVAGAAVMLVPAGMPAFYLGDALNGTVAQAHTDGEGRFVLHVDPEKIKAFGASGALLVVRRGFAAAQVALRTDGGSVLVRLARGVPLRGRVIDETGGPVAGVAVAAADGGLLPGGMPSHLLLAGFRGPGYAVTDADGRFALQVENRAHHLGFHKPGLLPQLVLDRAPAAPDPLVVTLARGVAIRGRVERGGAPVADVRVVARPAATAGDVLALARQAGADLSAVTDAGGRFEITGISPGPYTLHAAEAAPGGWAKAEAAAPADGVAIELRPTGSLRGRVTDGRDHKPLPSFSVELSESRAGEDEDRGDEDEDWEGSRAESFSDGSGAFDLAGVPEGTYDLTVQAEGLLALRREGVVVAAAGEPTFLELELDAGATLRGHVSDEQDQPLADVTVAVAGDDGADATTDEAGDYELRAVAPGKAQVSFRKPGFRAEKKSAEVPPEGARVDARLRRGLVLAGVVVQEGGAPVADARVVARSAAAGAEDVNVEADAQGRFRLEGLVPGRYAVSATADEGRATQQDVDPEKAGALRLVVAHARTAVLFGRVIGMPAGETVMRIVYVQAEDGRSGRSTVDADGHYRVVDAPAGRVRAVAMVASLDGGRRTSRALQLTLAPDAETEAALEFASDVVISGQVVRAGEPVVGSWVSFQPVGGSDGQTARSDANGRYEVVGLEPGLHQVSVGSRDVSFETEYVVAASAQLDLDVTGAGLSGRVVAADDQRPLAAVAISLWRLDGRDNTPVTTLTTAADGAFSARAVHEGRYRLVTSLAGFGQEVRELELARGEAGAVEIALSPAAGLRVSVVDARDRRPLDALIAVRDASRRIVANAHSGVDQDGALTISLAPGRYVLSTSATGYGTATLPVTAPSEGLQVGLTPGGTLELESARPMTGRVRLIQPDGEEYVRCWCNGIAEIRLSGTRTRIENVTPGAYRVELVGETGEVRPGPTVAVREGELTTAAID